jgi:ABC-2 type transport system permease protein
VNDVFEYIFPGLMLLWICFIANGSFVDIFEEYKAQTMARLITSGVTIGDILVSKILRCLAICWICQLLLILFTGVVFDVGWRNPLLLLVLLTSFNVCLIGILALVYGYARSSDMANSIMVFVILISAFLGGSFIPFKELPQALQNIGQWTMLRMGSYGIESIFQARSLWEVVRPSLFLTGAGLILMTLGVRVMRRRFETGNVA